MNWKKAVRNVPLLIGASLFTVLFVLFAIGLVYTPYSTEAMNTAMRLHQPNAAHWFGTDNFGRDLLSRIMEGAQTAFYVGSLSVVIGIAGGLVVGSLAGYFGGWLDEIIMRVMDGVMAFPGILFALMLVTVFGPGVNNTILALGLMSIPGFTRIIRSGVIQYKEFEFVKAAKVRGAGSLRIIASHILPNMISPLVVAAALAGAGSVLAEAGLSYLGLGVQPPLASWGRMLNEAQPYVLSAPWYTISTGCFITAMVLSLNFIADGLRDAADKRK
ncbi:ABC transporter permease [Paenibacillus sp. GCM10027626]|uniref:ABC transporter permease n=1 Tax=Paenibacillus sp. GCM10027626 TaxID=3273411 RepID=UPI0036429E72